MISVRKRKKYRKNIRIRPEAELLQLTKTV